MAYVLLIGFSLYIFCRYASGKSVDVAVLVYSLIAPCVSISSSMKVDSFYLLIVIMIVLNVLHGAKLKIERTKADFLLFSLIVVMMFAFSWIVKSRVSEQQFIISLLGALKPAVAIVLIDSLYQETHHSRSKYVLRAIKIVAVINFIAIVIQYLLPQQSFDLFSELYSSNSSTYYLQDTNVWGMGGFYQGKYIRYFGIFENPMVMACFCSLALCFFIPKFFDSEKIKKSDVAYVIILVISGMSSATKTFVFSLPLIVVMTLVLTLGLSVGNKRRNVRSTSVLLGGFVVITFCAVIIFYDDLYNMIYAFNPMMAHYFGYLKNPISALSTRFGGIGTNSSGLLAATIQVIKSNLIIGVGPVSVRNEPIGDSSYIVMLHNAGLVGIFILALYILSLLSLVHRNGDIVGRLLLYLVAFMGIALNILVGANVTIFVYYYILSLGQKSGTEIKVGEN